MRGPLLRLCLLGAGMVAGHNAFLAAAAPGGAEAPVRTAVPTSSATRPAGPGDVAALRERVTAAAEKVRRLEAAAYAADPDLKDFTEAHARIQERDVRGTDRRYVVARFFDKLEQQDAASRARQKYEQLKLLWRPKSLADLVQDPKTEGAVKLVFTHDPEMMRRESQSLREAKPELAAKDLSTPAAFWDAAKPVLVEAGQRSAGEFEAAARESGLPRFVVEQAKEDSEIGAAELFELAVETKVPPELAQARRQLRELEAALSRASNPLTRPRPG